MDRTILWVFIFSCLVAFSCSKPKSEAHSCKWDKCPYKSVRVDQWDKAVTDYVGERMTDAWCIDMLHLEFPEEDYEKLEERLFKIRGAKSRMDIAITLEKELGVKFLVYDVDSDGLVTASWEYPDHRIGGTDWTDSENIGKMVNEQRNWKVCMDGDCLNVVAPDREPKYHGKCWRHFPIPDKTDEEVILIDAEDMLRSL